MRWRDGGGFGCEGLHHCVDVFQTPDFGIVPLLASLLSQNVGRGDGRKSRWSGRFRQSRIAGRVAGIEVPVVGFHVRGSVERESGKGKA